MLLRILFEFSYASPAGYNYYTPFAYFPYFTYGIAAYLGLSYLRKIMFSVKGFI